MNIKLLLRKHRNAACITIFQSKATRCGTNSLDFEKKSFPFINFLKPIEYEWMACNLIYSLIKQNCGSHENYMQHVINHFAKSQTKKEKYGLR